MKNRMDYTLHHESKGVDKNGILEVQPYRCLQSRRSDHATIYTDFSPASISATII
jgi:hypothetical protein